MAVVLLGAGIGFAVVAAISVAGTVVIAIIERVKKEIELSKIKAFGMPPTPPGMKKRHMKNAAEKLKLDYQFYNFAFCGPQGAGGKIYSFSQNCRNLSYFRQIFTNK